MAELSPQSQAVYDAFIKYWQDEPVMQDRRCLAAALRAAAEKIPIPGSYKSEWAQGFVEGVKCVQSGLQNIAHELEQHQ